MPFKALAAALALSFGFCMPKAAAQTLSSETKSAPCMSCHAVDNTHGAPSLDGLPAAYLLKQFDLYKAGKRFGPIMQTQLNALAVQDLEDIARYFSSRRATRSSTKIAFDRQVTQRGRALAEDLKCTNCHGPNNSGTHAVPRLAGQLRNYLALAIGKLQRDPSLHPPMDASGEIIPQTSVEALATYFASLEP